jgi:hypothetical protein
MGICHSKPDIVNPATIAGSTVINGNSVMILDGRFLIPASDTNSGESSVIEVDMKNRRVQILRGAQGRMTNAFINSTRRKKSCDKAFANVKSDEDEYESDGLQRSPEGSTISCHEKRETEYNI